MFYEFPEIKKLSDLERAIEGREEFSIDERDWGYYVCYNVNFADTFPDVVDEVGILRRECRGIKFDRNGDIAARPLHKFFNLNERSDTQLGSIDWSHPYMILEKLDGSQIHPILIDGEILWFTKRGNSEAAQKAADYVSRNPHYNDMALEFIRSGYTPIFEYCAPNNQIVVRYTEEKMTLLAARHIVQGVYVDYEYLLEAGRLWNIPVIGAWQGNTSDIKSFVDYANEQEDEEGYIIRFRNGHMVKIKNSWYVRLHKMHDNIRFEKNVWGMILRNEIDDILPFLQEEVQNNIKLFSQDLYNEIGKTANKARDIVNKYKAELGDNKKAFAQIAVRDHYDLRHILFHVWDGGDPHGYIVNKILNHLHSQPRLDSVRFYANGIRWDDYKMLDKLSESV